MPEIWFVDENGEMYEIKLKFSVIFFYLRSHISEGGERVKDFETLYRTYFDDIFRFLRMLTKDTLLAEELTQETFFKAIRGIDGFKGECEIRVWLCQIAKNSFYSYLKKQRPEADAEEITKYISAEPHIEHLLVDKEQAMRLHQILHILNEPYKEVFSLRVFGELSFKEIGSLFEKSEHWACITFHRAKKKIQQEMEGK